MGELTAGNVVGFWNGGTDITVTKEIGTGFDSKGAAIQAAKGKQAVLTQEADGKFHAYEIDDGHYLDDLNLGEDVKGATNKSTVQVLDFVDAAGHEIMAGKKHFPPTGPDNGKVVHFMIHVPNAWQAAAEKIFNNTSRWDDDIQKLQAKGYTVVVDFNTSKDEIKAAFHDPRTAGVIFHGHGNSDGQMETGGPDADPLLFGPYSIDPKKVSPNLKMVVFQACEVMQARKEWEQQVPGANFYGWTTSAGMSDIATQNGKWGGPTKYQVLSGESPDRLDRLIDKDL